MEDSSKHFKGYLDKFYIKMLLQRQKKYIELEIFDLENVKECIITLSKENWGQISEQIINAYDQFEKLFKKKRNIKINSSSDQIQIIFLTINIQIKSKSYSSQKRKIKQLKEMDQITLKAAMVTKIWKILIQKKQNTQIETRSLARIILDQLKSQFWQKKKYDAYNKITSYFFNGVIQDSGVYYNGDVFQSIRIRQAVIIVNYQKKLHYFPTTVTKIIAQNITGKETGRLKNILINGDRGIGKTFGQSLCYELTKQKEQFSMVNENCFQKIHYYAFPDDLNSIPKIFYYQINNNSTYKHLHQQILKQTHHKFRQKILQGSDECQQLKIINKLYNSRIVIIIDQINIYYASIRDRTSAAENISQMLVKIQFFQVVYSASINIEPGLIFFTEFNRRKCKDFLEGITKVIINYNKIALSPQGFYEIINFIQFQCLRCLYQKNQCSNLDLKRVNSQFQQIKSNQQIKQQVSKGILRVSCTLTSLHIRNYFQKLNILDSCFASSSNIVWLKQLLNKIKNQSFKPIIQFFLKFLIKGSNYLVAKKYIMIKEINKLFKEKKNDQQINYNQWLNKFFQSNKQKNDIVLLLNQNCFKYQMKQNSQKSQNILQCYFQVSQMQYIVSQVMPMAQQNLKSRNVTNILKELKDMVLLGRYLDSCFQRIIMYGGFQINFKNKQPLILNYSKKIGFFKHLNKKSLQAKRLKYYFGDIMNLSKDSNNNNYFGATPITHEIKHSSISKGIDFLLMRFKNEGKIYEIKTFDFKCGFNNIAKDSIQKYKQIHQYLTQCNKSNAQFNIQINHTFIVQQSVQKHYVNYLKNKSYKNLFNIQTFLNFQINPLKQGLKQNVFYTNFSATLHNIRSEELYQYFSEKNADENKLQQVSDDNTLSNYQFLTEIVYIDQNQKRQIESIKQKIKKQKQQVELQNNIKQLWKYIYETKKQNFIFQKFENFLDYSLIQYFLSQSQDIVFLTRFLNLCFRKTIMYGGLELTFSQKKSIRVNYSQNIGYFKDFNLNKYKNYQFKQFARFRQYLRNIMELSMQSQNNNYFGAIPLSTRMFQPMNSKGIDFLLMRYNSEKNIYEMKTYEFKCEFQKDVKRQVQNAHKLLTQLHKINQTQITHIIDHTFIIHRQQRSQYQNAIKNIKNMSEHTIQIQSLESFSAVLYLNKNQQNIYYKLFQFTLDIIKGNNKLYHQPIKKNDSIIQYLQKIIQFFNKNKKQIQQLKKIQKQIKNQELSINNQLKDQRVRAIQNQWKQNHILLKQSFSYFLNRGEFLMKINNQQFEVACSKQIYYEESQEKNDNSIVQVNSIIQLSKSCYESKDRYLSSILFKNIQSFTNRVIDFFLIKFNSINNNYEVRTFNFSAIFKQRVSIAIEIQNAKTMISQLKSRLNQRINLQIHHHFLLLKKYLPNKYLKHQYQQISYFLIGQLQLLDLNEEKSTNYDKFISIISKSLEKMQQKKNFGKVQNYFIQHEKLKKKK